MQNSLSRRLHRDILFTFGVIATLFVALGAVMQQRWQDESTQAVTRLLDTLVSRENDTLANELFEKRVEALKIRLAQISKVDDILRVTLYDAAGQPVVSASRGATTPVPASLPQDFRSVGVIPQTTPAPEALRFIKAISAVDETLGWIEIEYDLYVLHRQTVVFFGFFLGLLLITLLCMQLLLRRRLRQSVLTPLLHLGEIMDKMRTMEPLVPAPLVQADNEIARLLESFRQMAARLSASYRELDEAHDALRDSEQRLSLALGATNDGLWDWSIDESRTFFSPRYYTMLGYADGEFEASYDSWRSLLHPDDAERAEQIITAHLTGTKPFEIEFRMRCKSGHWLWLLARGKVVEWDDQGRATRVVGTHVDISERKEAEEALRTSEALTRAMMDQTLHFLGLLDTEGRILLINRTALDFAGSTMEQLAGHPFWEAPWWENSAHARELCREAMAMALSGRVFRREVMHVGAQGQRRIVDISFSPFTESGAVIHLIVEGRDITDMLMAQEAMAESGRRFRSIFDNSPAGIFRASIQGQLIAANQACLDMFGYATLEEAARNFDEISAKADLFAHASQSLLSAMAASPQRFSTELEFVRKDGTRFNCLLYASLQSDADGSPLFIDGILEDITQRKQAEERLRQSEEKFSRLFRLSPDAIILLHLNSERIQDANEAFLRLFGFTREEVLGRTSKELGIYQDPQRRKTIFAQLHQEGHAENFEIEARRKDGGRLDCALSCQVMTLGGEEHLLTVFRDVTQTKKMQEVMVQTEKMISVGGIAAGIAHEINNPLGIVLQAAQNLVQRTRPDFKKNLEAAARLGLDMALLRAYMQDRKLDVFIEDIQSAALRASGIIRHMLDFSRRSESRRTICWLPDIVDKAVALASSDFDLKKQFDFKRIRIVRDFADDLPSLQCTETEIEQVLLNLLRNAAQAMAEKTMDPDGATIIIRLRGENDALVIEVEDNGPGIPPSLQSRIFEPFFTTKPTGVGTGLGLSVSYFIVTKGHGGVMTVTSEPGKGTTFTIRIPALAPGER